MCYRYVQCLYLFALLVTFHPVFYIRHDLETTIVYQYHRNLSTFSFRLTLERDRRVGAFNIPFNIPLSIPFSIPFMHPPNSLMCTEFTSPHSVWMGSLGRLV